jgi:hypothetical protein
MPWSITVGGILYASHIIFFFLLGFFSFLSLENVCDEMLLPKQTEPIIEGHINIDNFFLIFFF